MEQTRSLNMSSSFICSNFQNTFRLHQTDCKQYFWNQWCLRYKITNTSSCWLQASQKTKAWWGISKSLVWGICLVWLTERINLLTHDQCTIHTEATDMIGNVNQDSFLLTILGQWSYFMPPEKVFGEYKIGTLSRNGLSEILVLNGKIKKSKIKKSAKRRSCIKDVHIIGKIYHTASQKKICKFSVLCDNTTPQSAFIKKLTYFFKSNLFL